MSNSVKKRSSKKFSEYKQLVSQVIKVYAEVLTLPAVAAAQVDDEQPAPHKLVPGGVALDFKVDVEQVSGKALRGRPLLQIGWCALVEGRQLLSGVERRVVELLGPAYETAGLRPTEYFRKTRRGSVQSQRRMKEEIANG